MWNDRYSAAGLSLFGRAVFDPVTMTVLTVGSTLVGGGMTAAGALASGSYAKTAGQMQQAGAKFQADQVDQNAGQAIGSSQRTMLDTQEKTRLAISSSTARAAGSGVNAGVGSPAGNVGDLAQRGSYHALMDLWNGQSAASGLDNQAKGIRYTGALDEVGGEMQKSASYLAAGGDIASAIGSGAARYGAINYPRPYGSVGARL